MLLKLVKEKEMLEDFVLNFIVDSYEGSVIGLDLEATLDCILDGRSLSERIAIDNIVISKISGHDEIFLEERNGDLVIKDELLSTQLAIAEEQLACYEIEKTLLSALNHKIKLTQYLISKNYFNN